MSSVLGWGPSVAGCMEVERQHQEKKLVERFEGLCLVPVWGLLVVSSLPKLDAEKLSDLVRDSFME
jgi:hypothetical protein